jgi:hypothetical protein
MSGGPRMWGWWYLKTFPHRSAQNAVTSKKMEELITGAAEPKTWISVPIYSIK